MNTYFNRSFRCWTAMLMCCLLLTAARAQDTATPPADDGKTTTFDSPSSDGEHSHDYNHDSDHDDDYRADHHSHSHHHFHRHSDDVVSIGHGAELSAGEHADGVVAIFGSATTAGDVDDAVVSVLGSTRVTGGRVSESAVAVMGSVYVNGEVNGDVVAVMGSVELGPEAKVHGNIVVVGGELKRDPSAVIDGHVQNVFGVDWADFAWTHPWIERCLLYGRPLAFSPGLGWAWGIALGLLALYAFIAFAFRSAVDKCVHTLNTEPGHSILAALLLTLGVPVLFVLLFITVLGIAAVPFLAIAVICAAMFGKVVVLAAIGKRCTPSLANDPATHTVVGVIVGGLIVMVIYTIPVVGFVVYKVLELLGLGVVVYTLLQSVRAGRAARTGGPGGGPGAGGTGGSGGPWPGTGGPGVGGAGGGFTSDSGARADAAGGLGASAAAGTGASAAAGRGASAARGASFGDFTADDPSGGAGTPGTGARGFTSGAADHPDATGANTAGADAPGANTSGANTTGASNMGTDSLGGAAGIGANAPGGGPPPYTTSGPTTSGPPGQPPLNVAALPRAGFGIRMGALLLDVILIGILTHRVHDHGDVDLLALAVYGAVMWKLKGSTVGGIVCGLQVVRVDGRPIDWPTAIVRALGCFLSLAVVGLGFIWIAIDHDKQSWHDKVAGTAVVRAPKGASLL